MLLQYIVYGLLFCLHDLVNCYFLVPYLYRNIDHLCHLEPILEAARAYMAIEDHIKFLVNYHFRISARNDYGLATRSLDYYIGDNIGKYKP